MDDEDRELRHLELRDVLLPPDRLLQLGLEGREEVVGIHHHVHEAIDDAERRGLAAAHHKLDVNINADHHYGVMVDVQKRHLVVLFAEDEEYLRGDMKHLVVDFERFMFLFWFWKLRRVFLEGNEEERGEFDKSLPKFKKIFLNFKLILNLIKNSITIK